MDVVLVRGLWDGLQDERKGVTYQGIPSRKVFWIAVR